MFVGHYGPAFALKRVAPETSMLGLGIGVQLVDIAWAIFIFTGIEQVRIIPGFTESNSLDLHYIPYTHGLISALLWSLAGGLVAWLVAKRASPRIFVAIALSIASHWILDLLMHRPDLPIYGDSMKVGLGLWNYRWPAFIAEIIVLGAGLLYYARGSRPKDAIGRFGPIAMFVALTGTQLFNLLVSPTSTPVDTAAGALISFVVIPVVMAFVDRHREHPKKSPR
jgi:hypothetical protein